MNENEKNEVMMVEQETIQEPETYYEEEERSGMSTGVAMLIGSGLTLAAIAVGKKLKKVYNNIKAAKAKEQSEAVEGEVVEEIDNK